MQILDNIIDIKNSFHILEKYDKHKILFFDIETTGFSPEITSLYLIGIMYYSDKSFHIRQYFNDDGKSEVEIISSFMEFSMNFEYLIHYNGDGFDIPYINNKFTEHILDYSFNHLTSIDLYKIAKPIKNALYLDNLKQKTVEQFLGVSREDIYSGRDLIKIYLEYLSTKNEKLKAQLMCHNYEDVLGVLLISEILLYRELLDGVFIVKDVYIKDQRFIITMELPYCLPKRISKGQNDILLTANGNQATLNIPIYEGELKFFFKDYKNYYYLPAEDKAIHKSVATYVDNDYRTKATKQNCYLKVSGAFVMEYNDGIMYGFRHEVNDKISYIELNNNFLTDKDLLLQYAQLIMRHI